MKVLFDAKTFLFFSMIRSERLAQWLDKFKNSKFWYFVAKTGIFFGFGFIGIYYWYRHDEKKWQKIIFWQAIIFVIAFFMVSALMSTFGLINIIISFLFFNLFGLAGFALYFLAAYSIKIIINYFLGKSSCPGVAPVIPGVQIPGIPIFIPALEGWLSILIILVLHELAHGVLARNIGVTVKSFGLVLAGFLPFAAFTEPSESELNTSKPKDQLLVYASGPMINFYLTIFVLILLFLFSLAVAPYVNNVHSQITDGVYLVGVTEYTGICNDGELSVNYGHVDVNAKILMVNNELIRDVNDFRYLQDSIIDSNKGYATFTLQKDSNVYDKNIFLNKDNRFGIQVMEKLKDNAEKPFWYLFIEFVSGLFYWLILLSLGVAIFNFLPTEPFDGGKMSKIIFGEFIFTRYPRDKRHKMIGFAFGIICLLFLLINLLPLFF